MSFVALFFILNGLGRFDPWLSDSNQTGSEVSVPSALSSVRLGARPLSRNALASGCRRLKGVAKALWLIPRSNVGKALVSWPGKALN